MANIQNFIDILGAEQSINSDDITVDSVKEMDMGDAKAVIQSVTREQFERMAPDVRTQLMEKARGN